MGMVYGDCIWGLYMGIVQGRRGYVGGTWGVRVGMHGVYQITLESVPSSGSSLTGDLGGVGGIPLGHQRRCRGAEQGDE